MRNEKKYQLSKKQEINFSSLISAVLTPDGHSVSENGYTVSSVYFDTPSLDFYREKTDGVYHRKKYRLRYYNGDLSFILLECKEKIGSVTNKVSERITKGEYESILSGDISFLKNADSRLKKEFFGLSKEKNIQPKCRVIYDRRAFLHPLSNTRITFDSNLRVSCMSSSNEFFVSDGNPVILEIKYDKFLPAYISEMLGVSQKEISVSKYQTCIQYILQNKGWLL